MDRTLEWGPTPSKTSYLKLFSFLVLVYFACCASSKGTLQVNRTVKDMVILSCGYNISTLELTKMRIYWQKQNNLVLTVINGQVKAWNKYENRTFADFSNNHSIVILGLRLSDNGTYTCIIQKLIKGSYKVEHRANVKLLVNAYFPVPSITDLGNPSPKIRRICCSTSGGFPEPHLSWLENEEELSASNITVSQDPETELYTISSELDFNVTNNHNFTCLVKYGGLKVSQTFIWNKITSTSESGFLRWIIIITCAFLLILVVVAAAVIACRHNEHQRGGRRNSENTEMRRITPSTQGLERHQIEQSGGSSSF